MYYIYRITNLVNGKTYIGQHKYKKLNDDYLGSGVLILKAIKKYGKENFVKEILYSNIQYKETADDMERFTIAKERKLGKAEYNIANGGYGSAGFHHTEEWKKKLSELNSGEKNRFYGKHHSEEARKRMSNSHKGVPLSEKHKKSLRGKTAWNKGVAMSDEAKKKSSKSHKGKPGYWEGKQLPEEMKKKLSDAHKGKHWKLVDGKRVYY